MLWQAVTHVISVRQKAQSRHQNNPPAEAGVVKAA